MAIKELDISPGFESQIAITPILYDTTEVSIGMAYICVSATPLMSLASCIMSEVRAEGGVRKGNILHADDGYVDDDDDDDDQQCQRANIKGGGEGARGTMYTKPIFSSRLPRSSQKVRYASALPTGGQSSLRRLKALKAS